MVAGGWKTILRASDLADDTKLELVCRRCEHVRYATRQQIEAAGMAQLYIDEIEARASCRVKGCGGKVRIAMMHKNATSGFVGGLA